MTVHHYNDTRSTMTRWYDNDQRHVTAFRLISEAAHSWSYDKNIWSSVLVHSVQLVPVLLQTLQKFHHKCPKPIFKIMVYCIHIQQTLSKNLQTSIILAWMDLISCHGCLQGQPRGQMPLGQAARVIRYKIIYAICSRLWSKFLIILVLLYLWFRVQSCVASYCSTKR